MSEIKYYHKRISNFCTQSIPKRIGAYVITHTEDNIHAKRYVGSTENLYKRMHGQDHLNKEILYVDLHITDDIELAQSLERILIKLIKPISNIQNPSLSHKDKEIMKELLMNTNLKNHISDNTIKVGYRYLKHVNGIIKKLGYSNRKDGIKHIGLPNDWGNYGDKVLIETINEKELKMKIVN